MSYSKGDQGFSFHCAWQAGVITCLKVESGSLEDRSGRRRREERGQRREEEEEEEEEEEGGVKLVYSNGDCKDCSKRRVQANR